MRRTHRRDEEGMRDAKAGRELRAGEMVLVSPSSAMERIGEAKSSQETERKEDCIY